MQSRLDNCIAKITRLKRTNYEYETTNKILNADNKQLRAEISTYADTNKQLEKDKEDLYAKLNDADIKVKSISIINAEILRNDARNLEKIQFLDLKLREATDEI
jgi:hypothetical protein